MSDRLDTEPFTAPATAFANGDERAWETTYASSIPRPRVTLRDAESAPAAPLAADLPRGGAGRYKILGEIARGGMGAVLRGRDSDLNRDLAVKVLLEQHRDQPDILRRFFEEAQIGGQLQHPGIVPVYEMGTFADNRPFFAMKLVKGRTLAELLRERRTVEEECPRLLGIFEQVCQTIAYAHSRGVIHRDLKPLNIMVGAFGEVQVMDWGLAKVLGGGSDSKVAIPAGAEVSMIRTVRSDSNVDASLAGSVMGTPAYMPPEQAHGEIDRLDERADVFGLGSILCEILTGKPAYSGRSAAETLRMAEHADLADAWSRLENAAVDAELIAIAKACLAAEPDDRPRDARAVAERLTAHLTGVQARLRAAEFARVEAAAGARAERVRKHFTVALIGSLCLTLLIGGGSWLAFVRYRDSRLSETGRTVGAAMLRAEGFHQKALHKGLGDREAWDQALTAADRVRDVLSGRVARPEMKAQVAAFYAVVQQDAEKASARFRQEEADRALVKALELACLEYSDGLFQGRAVTPHYARAFRDAGIDVETSSAETAIRALEKRSQTERIASALDDWASRDADATRRDKLMAISRAIDPDPFRNRVRDAAITRDAAALKALAAAPETDRLPPLSLDLLALSLAHLDAKPEATALLARAQRRFPDDFWINHDLGMLYLLGGAPRPDEAIRFLTTAVALKPDNPGARLNLGQALASRDRHEDAHASFREAVRLKPDFAPALLRLRAGIRARRPLVGIGVTAALRRWKTDPRLAALRDPEALAKLPEDQRRAWQGVWADIEAMLAKDE